MRKWMAILLALAMMLTLTGCEDLNDVLEFCGELGELLSAISTMPLEDLEDLIPTEPNVTDAPDENPTEPPAEDPTKEPGNKDPQKDPTEIRPAPTDAPTEPDNSALTELWDRLQGCWADGENYFAYFTYDGNTPTFISGNWEEPVPWGREAAVASDLVDYGGGRYGVTLTYPPVDGDARDNQDLQPLTFFMTMTLDELDKGIICLEAPQDDTRYYNWVGYTYDDGYDATHQVSYATFGEMQEFWQWLVGYWNSDDGHFVCFDQKDSNSLVFMHGIWDSGSRGWADFEKAMSGYMDLPMKFVVCYPSVSNELDGDLPAEYVVVYVDWMEVETHGHIFVQIGENGEWVKYTFAGYSESDAHPN